MHTRAVRGIFSAGLLSLLLWAGAAAGAEAQMRIGLAADRYTFLLYEPIVLHLTVQNDAGFDMVFQDQPGHPWLTFLITRADRSAVNPDRQIPGRDLSLGDGKSVTLDVDVTPLYAMRETGPYKIQAVVDVGGRQFLSAPISVTLVNGKRIWSETRNVEGSPRTYSLLRFAPSMKGTFLYLRVEDAAQNLVYSNSLLGEVIDVQPPQVLFDDAGQIHVLHLAGTETYRYTRASVDGAVLSQSVYAASDEGNAPSLARAGDGGILVAGGRQENKENRRERLSEVQAQYSAPHQTVGAPTAGPRPGLPAAN